jgi:pimeloyl-ACP methyl ester carboxylesterase
MFAELGETFVRRALQGLREGDAPEAPELDGSRAPVVLLHGFGVTSAVLRPLEARIRRSTGRPCLRLRLGCRLPLHLADVRRSARRAERALERLAQRARFGRVDVVGHSLGGLVATYWLKCIDHGRRIRRVITLGTPHHGTPFAALGVLLFGVISPAVWQMLPGSPFVRRLAALPVPEGSELVALGSRDDSVVPAQLALPRPAARLRTAVLARVRHVDFLWSREVFGHVAGALAGDESSDEVLRPAA